MLLNSVILKVCEEYNINPNIDKKELIDILFEIAYGGDLYRHTRAKKQTY